MTEVGTTGAKGLPGKVALLHTHVPDKASAACCEIDPRQSIGSLPCPRLSCAWGLNSLNSIGYSTRRPDLTDQGRSKPASTARAHRPAEKAPECATIEGVSCVPPNPWQSTIQARRTDTVAL